MNLKTLAIALTTFILMACKSNDQIPSVSPETFRSEYQAALPDATLLDVRTPVEYSDGHIAGALNIDVQAPGFIEEAIKELPKDKPVYVYCRSGKRSMMAARALAARGYKVVNLDGGILAWEAASLPTVR